MRLRYRTRILLTLLLAALLHAEPGLSEAVSDHPVAVIYPEVREPYRTVFLDIVKGMESELPGRIQSYELAIGNGSSPLPEQLLQQQKGAAVFLGKYGLLLSTKVDPGMRRVVGAVLTSPDDIPKGVMATSLAPAPRALFSRLHELAPQVKTIHVIHGSDSNDWLIARAEVAARELGLTLIASRKQSIREGANAYRELLAQSGPEDAVWLLQASPFLEESSVLQMILRAAWDRNIVVFSSNGSHVPKGALFAMFSDNVALGAYLARLAAGKSAAEPGLQPLEQLNVALNIRTADHLGLGLDARDPRFSMVFPSR